MTSLDNARTVINRADILLIERLCKRFKACEPSHKEELKQEAATLAKGGDFDPALAEEVFEVVGDYVDDVEIGVIISLAARFHAVAQVAAYKKEHNLPAVDETRRNEVIANAAVNARGLACNPELATALIRAVVLYFEKIQDEYFTHNTGPFSAPKAV